MTEYIKWSAKAIWGLVAPIVVVLINENREIVENWIAGTVAGVITAVLVWLQKNGPAPSDT